MQFVDARANLLIRYARQQATRGLRIEYQWKDRMFRGLFNILDGAAQAQILWLQRGQNTRLDGFQSPV